MVDLTKRLHLALKFLCLVSQISFVEKNRFVLILLILELFLVFEKKKKISAHV